MTEGENGSSNNNNVNAMEEGIVNGDSASTSGSAKKRVMSVISAKYDIDHTGSLDSTQFAMRQMDTTNQGYVSNEKVYALLKQQQHTQRQLLSYKRIIMFMTAFLVVLALAVLGTSFAAATLAKDTTTSHNVLVIKDSGMPVETDTYVYQFHVTPDDADDEQQRRSLQDGGTTTTFVQTTGTLSQADAYEVRRLCGLGKAVTLTLVWFANGAILQNYPVCSSHVAETIVDVQDRDGTLTGYSVSNPSDTYEFQSGAVGGKWAFTVE